MGIQHGQRKVDIVGAADRIPGAFGQSVEFYDLHLQHDGALALHAGDTVHQRVLHDRGNLLVTIAQRVFAPDDIGAGLIGVGLGHDQNIGDRDVHLIHRIRFAHQNLLGLIRGLRLKQRPIGGVGPGHKVAGGRTSGQKAQTDDGGNCANGFHDVVLRVTGFCPFVTERFC